MTISTTIRSVNNFHTLSSPQMPKRWILYNAELLIAQSLTGHRLNSGSDRNPWTAIHCKAYVMGRRGPFNFENLFDVTPSFVMSPTVHLHKIISKHDKRRREGGLHYFVRLRLSQSASV